MKYAPIEPVYFTPEELAARYRNAISLRTLANWRSRKEGPGYVKIGGKVFYPVPVILEWEATRQIMIR